MSCYKYYYHDYYRYIVYAYTMYIHLYFRTCVQMCLCKQQHDSITMWDWQRSTLSDKHSQGMEYDVTICHAMINLIRHKHWALSFKSQSGFQGLYTRSAYPTSQFRGGWQPLTSRPLRWLATIHSNLQICVDKVWLRNKMG